MVGGSVQPLVAVLTASKGALNFWRTIWSDNSGVRPGFTLIQSDMKIMPLQCDKKASLKVSGLWCDALPGRRAAVTL